MSIALEYSACRRCGVAGRGSKLAARNLVVLYLSGGNDGLSTVVPYGDPQYFARRPNLAIPAASVLQIGTDSAGNRLGLNPRLTDLRTIFNSGRLAIIQRTGYPNQSRSHFQGTDIWSSADPTSPQSMGWLGRYLDRLPAPVDPLTACSTVRETPRTLLARTVGIAAIPSVTEYAFASPNTGADAAAARQSATRIASHIPVDQPHLAFVNATAQGAFATLDRVIQVGTYAPSVTYPNNGLGQALHHPPRHGAQLLREDAGAPIRLGGVSTKRLDSTVDAGLVRARVAGGGAGREEHAESHQARGGCLEARSTTHHAVFAVSFRVPPADPARSLSSARRASAASRRTTPTTER